MDPETQAHIDADRRPQQSGEPKRIAGLLGEPPHTTETADTIHRSYVDYAERQNQRTLAALDRMMPVELVAIEDETVVDVEDRNGNLELVEREGYSGPGYRIPLNCLRCDQEISLFSIEEPGLYARAVGAGMLRRLRGMFICTDCEKAIVAEEEAAETAERRAHRLAASELSPHLQGMYFPEMFPSGGRKYIVEQVREWSAAEVPREPHICLWGRKGAGKTRLAATAAFARLQRWPVKWVSLPVLLAKLGAAFNDAARREAISVLTGTGPLILDDIARDDIKVSDWAKTQIFTAVDTRIQAGAPLLITTNMSPDKLEPVLGGSVMSRVAGMAVYELPGRDNRIELGGMSAEQAEADAAEHGLRDPEAE